MQVVSTFNNFFPRVEINIPCRDANSGFPNGSKNPFYTPLDEERHCGRKMSFQRTQGIEPRPLIWRELR